jgi:hypothetical protein
LNISISGGRYRPFGHAEANVGAKDINLQLEQRTVLVFVDRNAGWRYDELELGQRHSGFLSGYAISTFVEKRTSQRVSVTTRQENMSSIWAGLGRVSLGQKAIAPTDVSRGRFGLRVLKPATDVRKG